jgi:hypothetical protein
MGHLVPMELERHESNKAILDLSIWEWKFERVDKSSSTKEKWNFGSLYLGAPCFGVHQHGGLIFFTWLQLGPLNSPTYYPGLRKNSLVVLWKYYLGLGPYLPGRWWHPCCPGLWAFPALYIIPALKPKSAPPTETLEQASHSAVAPTLIPHKVRPLAAQIYESTYYPWRGKGILLVCLFNLESIHFSRLFYNWKLQKMVILDLILVRNGEVGDRETRTLVEKCCYPCEPFTDLGSGHELAALMQTFIIFYRQIGIVIVDIRIRGEDKDGKFWVSICALSNFFGTWVGGPPMI